MRKTENKLIVVLLAVVFALAAFGMQTEPAFAAEVQASGNCGTDVTWTYDSDGVLTISGSGAMENYANPAAPPYMGNDIVRLVVEEGVTGIGANAFGGLFLDYVMLPESLTAIGQNAFDAAPIEEAHFAGNLKQWRDCVSVASGNNTLTEVITMDSDVTYAYVSDDASRGFNLANGILTIWDNRATADAIDYSYYGGYYPEYNSFKEEYSDYIFEVSFDSSCNQIPAECCAGLEQLQTVTIPDSITYIGGYAFRRCSNLVSVEIPESVTTLRYAVFYECSSLTDVQILGDISSIEFEAFSGCDSLVNITIPDSVTIIGTGAFHQCYSLTSMAIPNSVTSIEANAFSECNSLTDITLSNRLTSIGNNAFGGCRSLTSIVIPDSVKSIGKDAFAQCTDLSAVSLPEGITSIEDSTFSWCVSLTTISIPESVTSIGNGAFYNCNNLSSITLSNNITYIDNSAFCYCSALVNIVIPDSVTSIGVEAFAYCSGLLDITIPDGVTSIGLSAFCGCGCLTSITIPNSVTTIDDSAFQNCGNLRSVFFDGSRSQWQAIEIGLGNEALMNATVYYPVATGEVENAFWTLRTNGLLRISGSGSVPDYSSLSDAPWSIYSNQITSLYVGTCITDIGQNAFASLSSLTTVESLGKVKTIGERAFSGCSLLTTIPLPDTLTSIGENAFAGCTALDTISIGSRVTSIGQNAFYGCTHLTTAGAVGSGSAIEFGWRTAIPANAFYGANYLQSIVIPEGVTRIMKGALQNCTSLTTVNLPSSLKTIYADVFKGCTALTNISIPSGVTSIGSDALADCTALTEVVVDSANTAYCSEFGVLFNKSKTELILYPAKKTGTIYEIPGTVETVTGNAFSTNTYLAEITIHEALTSVGDGAFNGCTSITDVWYDSTDNKWNSITIGADNAPLINATIHATHEYGEPTWTWAADYSTAEAVFTCLNGDSTQRVAAVVTSVTEPATCELGDAVIYTATVTFEGNDYTGTSIDEHGTALGHDWSNWTVVIDATCTAVGEESRTCSRCGKIETREIAIIEHTPATAAEENKVEPTCTEAGECDKVVYCSVCNHELSREHIVLDPLGHDWSEWTATVPPTCTAEGEETRTCSRCGIAETRVAAIIAHTPSEPVEENRADPTCTSEGSHDLVVYCTECGTEISRNWETIPELGHDYDVAVTDPTCTEQGFTTHTCTRCWDSYVDDYKDALGHDWSEWAETIAPTCASFGEDTRTCGRCGTIDTREVAKLAHTPGEEVEEGRIEPDCDVDGSYDMVVYCTECGEEVSRNTYSIDATGHNYTVFYEWSSDNSSVLAFAICTKNSRHVVTETVDVTSEVTKPATEYEVGETTYTAEFTNSVFETQTKVLANIDKLPHPYKVGDANDDGTVGTVDRVLLSRYLAGWPDILPLIKDINMMDINSDRTVNAKDRVILSRYIANWGEPYNSYFAQ